jgi:hypothetical protein
MNIKSIWKYVFGQQEKDANLAPTDVDGNQSSKPVIRVTSKAMGGSCSAPAACCSDFGGDRFAALALSVAAKSEAGLSVSAGCHPKGCGVCTECFTASASFPPPSLKADSVDRQNPSQNIKPGEVKVPQSKLLQRILSR